MAISYTMHLLVQKSHWREKPATTWCQNRKTWKAIQNLILKRLPITGSAGSRRATNRITRCANRSQSNQATFRVQFMATPKNMDTQSREFRGFPNVKVLRKQSVEIYCRGWNFLGWDQHHSQRGEEKYPDAFIIAFKNGVKIPFRKHDNKTQVLSRFYVYYDR